MIELRGQYLSLVLTLTFFISLIESSSANFLRSAPQVRSLAQFYSVGFLQWRTIPKKLWQKTHLDICCQLKEPLKGPRGPILGSDWKQQKRPILCPLRGSLMDISVIFFTKGQHKKMSQWLGAPQQCPIDNGNLIGIKLFVRSSQTCFNACELKEGCKYFR